MTDKQLQQRANLYARQAVINHGEFPDNGPELEAAVVTLIARAFVIGVACGVETAASVARTALVMLNEGLGDSGKIARVGKARK